MPPVLADPPFDLPADATATYDPGRSVRRAEATGATIAPNLSEAVQGPPQVTGLNAFSLIHRVGRGGMGEVWSAEQQALHRTVAVKTIRADLMASLPDDVSRERARREFVQEAVTTASLEHPHIVPVYDLGIDPDWGTPLLAMKLVKGESWDAALKADRPVMSVEDFLARHIPILISVAQAVAFAHSRGIVHRDLKPSQVMLGDFGEVLLMDWGLALVFDRDVAESALPALFHSQVTPTKELATSPSGTPAYMAPEQTDATAARVGTHTDVFLLGATLYAILTGTPPHSGMSSRDAFLRARDCLIDAPAVRSPDRVIPEELATLAMHAMKAEPIDRIPSAMMFVERLRDYLSGSGRRRESVTHSERATVLLAAASGYGDLTDCAHELDQAAALWPANPALRGLRQQMLMRHAGLALANGDLVLARVQAERIDDAPTREPLLHNIAGRQLAALRGARQRRVLLASTFVMIFVLLGGLIFVQQQQARVREEAAGRMLAQQRAEASQRTAKLLNEINTLRVDEANLADNIRAEAYDPSTDFIKRGSKASVSELGSYFRDDDAIYKRLGKRLADLRKRRTALQEQAGDVIGGEPSIFPLFDANRRWYDEVETKEDALKLYPDYEKVAFQNPREPEPLMMMAAIAALNQQSTSATLAIAGALDRTAARFGRQSSEFAVAQEMQSALLRGYLKDPKAARSAWDDARKLLLTDWIRLGSQLADMHRQLNYNEESLAFAMETLRASEILNGKDVPAMGPMIATVGVQLMTLGRDAEAEPWLKRSLALDENARGRNHSNTIIAVLNLARLSFRMGCPDEAFEGFSEARRRLSEVFPRNVRLDIETDRLEAECRTRIGDNDAALRLLEEAVSKSLLAFGPMNETTISCEASLLDALAVSGRLKEVELAGTDLLQRATLVLGDRHTVTRNVAAIVGAAEREGHDGR